VESESVISRTAKRALRNQAITRSAPVVGRALSSAGLGAIAYGSQMPTTVKVQYSLLTKRQVRSTMTKTERGWMTQYDDAIFREKRSGVKRVWRPGNPFAETRRMARNPPIGIPTDVKSPARAFRRKAVLVAGTGSVVLGRTLPIIAVGYVGHSLISGQSEGVNTEVQRLLYGGTIEEHKEMVEDVSDQTILGSPYAVIALRTTFTVGFGAVTGIFS